MMKMRLEDVSRAIRVYDRKKEGRSYEEISKELKLDDGGKGSGPDRAKDLFKTGGTLMRSVFALAGTLALCGVLSGA